MMNAPSDIFSSPEINMLTLCHKYPEFAHHFVTNNHLFCDIIAEKKIKNIPSSLLLKSFPRCNNVNSLILLRGTIIKVNPVLLKDVDQSFCCLYCNHEEVIKMLSNRKKKKMICDKCGKSKFKINEVFTKAKKCQTIRIQDIGNPKTMTDTIEILITGEQTGTFHPGENIEVLGLVKLKWPFLKVNEKLLPIIYLQAYTIKKTSKKETEIFEKLDDFINTKYFDKQQFLVKHYMSEIVGNENVKLAILLSAIYKKRQEGEARTNSHILLIGTPGTGKSHFLKSASRLAHSVSINGVGTSEAGLTTCAVKQGKEWVLEAGALILADNGICCIDSFDSLPLYDKRGLLEAMEQQTLSVAKAGLVSTLNARCSIVAAYNISYYDTEKSISENLKIASPLISRFDLIFLLREQYGQDRIISQKVLNRTNSIYKKRSLCTGVLKSYLEKIRNNQVLIPEGVTDIVSTYFKWRKKQKKEIFTIRNLESILRLAESHAKLLGKDVLDEASILTSILLIESSLLGTGRMQFDVSKIFIDEKYFNKKTAELKEILNEK